MLHRSACASWPTTARVSSRSSVRVAVTLGLQNEREWVAFCDQVIERLDRAQIANARVNDMQAVWQHPQLLARERWVSVQTPAGPVQALLPPGAGVDVTDPVRMDPVPALGRHTNAILAELGWSDADMERFRHDGAI